MSKAPIKTSIKDIIANGSSVKKVTEKVGGILKDEKATTIFKDQLVDKLHKIHTSTEHASQPAVELPVADQLIAELLNNNQLKHVSPLIKAEKEKIVDLLTKVINEAYVKNAENNAKLKATVNDAKVKTTTSSSAVNKDAKKSTPRLGG